MDCLFCKIAGKEIPATIIYENERLLAFRDISPQAPTHFLVVPRKHIATLNDLAESDGDLVGEMAVVAAELMKKEGHDRNGYRLVMNCNADGGQTVFHIHMHGLGGRAFGWPPG